MGEQGEVSEWEWIKLGMLLWAGSGHDRRGGGSAWATSHTGVGGWGAPCALLTASC